MHKDTIFALSTIFGRSGVAIIRISGKQAKQTLSHFQIKKRVIARMATLTSLYDSEGHLIDNALLTWFCAPNSFTGEEVIELHVHGSKGVINNILQELSRIFRIAEPGEFSRRAFENNKLDITRAEGLADLIEAETKMQARQAVRQMSGLLESLYCNWRHSLIEAMAELEAYIDFPDEDIPAQITVQIQKKISDILLAMGLHLKDNRRGQKMRSGFSVSIVGAPNVGKSTLFNYLVRQDMAIVSEIAGTTRDIIEAQIDLDGYPVLLSDTAGIQDTLDSIEIEGIARAKKRAKESDLTLMLFAIEDLYTIDESMRALIVPNTILIAAKADHVKQGVEILIEDKQLLAISVHSGVGLDQLMEKIKGNIVDQLAPSELPLITRERHRQAISSAAQHLEMYSSHKDLVLAAEDLRMAAKMLGQITGHIKIDDVLDQLFSKFCIGK